MDYEKKYNEALERARALWREAIEKEYVEDYLKDYETIFPELRESEDERIRRTLVEYFGPKVQLDFVRGIPIQKIRDWLEKQKEQKQTDLPAGFYYIDLNGNRYYSKEFRYGDMKLKVGEQKPLETPSPSVIYTEQGDVLAEQEPAWSEEDEKLLNYAISMTDDAQVKNFLKSLRPSWKPSEEQMKALQHAIDACESEWAYQDDELRSLLNDLKKL